MKKNHIAYLVSQYPAYSHTFILREVEQLQQLGLAIDVASINPPDRPLDKLTTGERHAADQTFYVKPQGVLKAALALGKTLAINPLGLLHGFKLAVKLAGWDGKSHLYHGFYLLEALLVGLWMQAQGTKHLHVHFATPAAFVGMLVKTVFGHGFSITVHGPDEFYDVSRYHLPAKILAADFIICISHYARSQMLKLAPFQAWPKFEVCRLGVDLTRFTPAPKTRPGELCQLLCVGRLTPAKGQAILLESVAQLIQQDIPVALTLVGMGADEQSLRRYAEILGISRLVNFTGPVDQEHILAYYHAADIFVLPSFAEGLPVVLMEAMAMEIPCISTVITGVPELIQHAQDGLLVAAADKQALTEAIKKLVLDQNLRQELGSTGRLKVQADYDIKKNARRLYTLFEQRLAGWS